MTDKPIEKDVHTRHCCSVHGCKYGDEECTVATLQKPQSYPCEMCEWEQEEIDHMSDYEKLAKATKILQSLAKSTGKPVVVAIQSPSEEG